MAARGACDDRSGAVLQSLNTCESPLKNAWCGSLADAFLSDAASRATP